MDQTPNYVETGGHPICHPIWSKILCRGDLKSVHPIIAKVRKTTDRRWSRVAATRDLHTIAFFRSGALLRRSVPVPGILAAHRPGRLWISLGAILLLVPDWATGLIHGLPMKPRLRKTCLSISWTACSSPLRLEAENHLAAKGTKAANDPGLRRPPKSANEPIQWWVGVL